MLGEITHEHVLLAFEKAKALSIPKVRTNYLIYEGVKYPAKYILRLAYQYGLNTQAPYFNADTAVDVLKKCGFEPLRTDTPIALDQYTPSNYTWVPFYQEMSPKLLQYTPSELINNLKQVLDNQNQVGLKDKDAAGNRFYLNDMDPYTFLSFLNKMGDSKRLTVLTQLRDVMNLTTPVPSDLDGLPPAQAQSVWLFAYSYLRQPDDINQLRILYRQVEEDIVTAKQFNQVLAIRKVGGARLTEVLFYQKPNGYLPINKQTKQWLIKRNLPAAYTDFANYQVLLEAVRQYDKRPFYEISREAYAESKALAEPSTDEPTYWVFQGNPAQFRIVKALEDNALQTWRVTSHSKKIKCNDKIILWVTGPYSGCYALAEVASDVYTGTDESGEQYYQLTGFAGTASQRVKINVLLNLWNRPVMKSDLQTLPVFAGFNGNKQGTNFTATQEQYETINTLAQTMPQSSIQHAKNIILYGPPGTGKTYETIDLAVDIIDGQKSPDHTVNKTRFDQLRKGGQIEFVTFHQNYTYEDFVIGLKPDVEAGSLKFEQREGIFYRLAKVSRQNYEDSLPTKPKISLLFFNKAFDKFIQPVKAGDEIKLKTDSGDNFRIADYQDRYKALWIKTAERKERQYISIQTISNLYRGIEKTTQEGPYCEAIVKAIQEYGTYESVSEPVYLNNYVLIIDEINRANMSRVFGELITLLEDDKRLGGENELIVTLPSGESFAVPPNLYLIGTMNTADKSLALLDIALRRRFEFIGKYPNYNVVEGPARRVLEQLNKAILAHNKPADFLIGHAYFIGKQANQLPNVFNNRIIPLLMEYFNGRTDMVKTLLKAAGVDSERHPLTDQLTVSYVGEAD